MQWQLHVLDLLEGICVYFLKALCYRFPGEKLQNSNSPVQYPVRHLQSHNINSISPAKMQRVTHTFSAVQQDCLTLKMDATQPFEAPGTTSHPTRTKQSGAPLTEPEITQE
jgi:hypothetical protein